MTNAEAIETLRANYPDACFEQLRCAVDMAINALTKEAWKEEHPVSPLLQKLATNLQPSKQDADDTISRKAAIDALMEFDKKLRKINWYQYPYIEHECRGVDKAIVKIANLPSAQPETHDKRTKTHSCDCISRQAAMEEISKQQTYKMFEGEDTLYLDANDVGSVLASLPSAQPDSKETSPTHKALDTISRQAAIRWVKTECNPYGKPTLDFESGKKVIEHLKQMPSAQPEHTNSCYTNSWCIDCKEYDTENKCCPRYNRVIKQTLDEVYAHAETEAEARYHAQQRWIPCSEKLPEANGRYLVTRGLVAAGALWNRVYIANYSNLMGIKSVKIWWQGNVGKSDFERLDDVLAWMPLPETYREGE